MKISEAIKLRGDKPKKKTEIDLITEKLTPILMNNAGWIIPLIVYLAISGFVLNIWFWKEHILLLVKMIAGGIAGFLIMTIYLTNKKHPYLKRK